MAAAEVLVLVHVLASVFLLSELALLLVWKTWADRRATPAQRAFVLDRVHALDRRATPWVAVLVFATGYPIIRILGLWGGRIATAPWAFASLVVLTLAGLAWYFVLLPLEVKMADAAEREAAGAPLDGAYARWSGVWSATLLVLLAAGVATAGLMVWKPGA